MKFYNSSCNDRNNFSSVNIRWSYYGNHNNITNDDDDDDGGGGGGNDQDDESIKLMFVCCYSGKQSRK